MNEKLESWEKILDPNFINAELIGEVGTERVVTIKDVEYREAYDEKKQTKVTKISLGLEECKPLILNKTNIKSIRRIFGTDEVSACIGHKIVLYVVAVKVAGKATTGIRIKEYSEVKCESCGKTILPTSTHSVAELIDISTRNCAKRLCVACMKKFKEENNNDK